MEVDISGGSLRAFYRSVAFLARVGPEILMDARADGPSSSASSLSLKSVNAARSAFARVRIARDAFDAFDVRAVGGRAQTCVLAKHALASLRSHARSDGCALTLDETTSRVRVRTTSAAKGTTRTYEMYEVTDAEQLDADIEAEEMPVKLVARAKTMNALLAHFASAAKEDVTLTFGVESAVNGSVGDAREAKVVTLSSYTNPSGGLSQALQTSISLRRDDETILFYRNTGGSSVDVTVNLKDLRSAVHLCEGSDVDVAIYCAQAGAPVLVKPTADYKAFHHRDAFASSIQPTQDVTPQRVDFEAELVLASMLPPDPPAVDPGQQPPSQERSAPPVEAAPPPPHQAEPAPLSNAPLGSQPWSAVPDSEDESQIDAGGADAAAPNRPWGQHVAARVAVEEEDDWAHGDEFVDATPPEKRRRS